MDNDGEPSRDSNNSNSSTESERARRAATLRHATQAQSTEPVVDPNVPPPRYPKKMRQWPIGGRGGPFDEYRGLTDIRRQYRVVKPTEVLTDPAGKTRTIKTFQRPLPGGGTIEVTGINRPWQGNYSHPADTGVTVEDLENVQIQENALVQNLRAHLPKLLNKTLAELTSNGLVSGSQIVTDTSRVLTEQFDFLNLPTVRFRFKEMDVLDENITAPFAKNAIAIETEELNDQLMHGQYGGQKWALEVEQLAAAEILWGLDDWLPGPKPNPLTDKNDKSHALCVRMAFRLFYTDRGFLNRIQTDIAAGRDHYFRNYPASVRDELYQALDDIKHYYPGTTRVNDDYLQLARDQWMADNNHWDHWTGKKIVIAVDKNNALMHWFFAEAVQSMCPPGTLAKMDRAIKAYGWLNPVSKAGKRFDVNKDYHLIKNPQHDFKRLEEMNASDQAVHSAMCGAEHMGTHNEQGKNNIFRQEMHKKQQHDDLSGEEHGWSQFENLQYGAMGIGTKISRFFLELLDPTLFAQYISHVQNIPEPLKLVTIRGANGKDCFSYRALNFNTHTEDHYDAGDHARGMAALQISGTFTGGDFILRDTKQMFEFSPGSQGFVRGPKQRHCTRSWVGDSRFCQVMTVKHRVWSLYPPDRLEQHTALDDQDVKKRKRDEDDAGGDDEEGTQGRKPPAKKLRVETADGEGPKKTTRETKGTSRSKRAF